MPLDVALADLAMARCDELATLSEEEGRLTRRFLTGPMRGVHERLSDWMCAAGLEPRVDHAGNLVGRRPGVGATRTLLIGSHLDTVPGAGRYDGVLGVLVGLAVAESLGGDPLPFHLDVVGFSEEEGVRYSKPYLGSSALAGCFEPEWLDRADADGVTLRDAISDFGLDPARVAGLAYPTDEVIGFVEPHLEQGPVLESLGTPVGVVTGIAGQSRLRLEFLGEAAHAGTTPMDGRCDALLCASRFVNTVREVALGDAGLRATVGKFDATPNAPNVIASRVELSLDVRHLEDTVREATVERLLAEGRRIAAAERARFQVLEDSPQSATLCDGDLSVALAEAVADCGIEPAPLPSGAGHDAVVMAKRFPTTMLFLRHPGGVSHHPDERVERDDVLVGIDVLSRFVRRLAERPPCDDSPVSTATNQG